MSGYALMAKYVWSLLGFVEQPLDPPESVET